MPKSRLDSAIGQRTYIISKKIAKPVGPYSDLNYESDI